MQTLVASLDLPTLSLRQLQAEASRPAGQSPGGEPGTCTQQLGESLESCGFVAITDHGVDPALLERAYALARTTFALPPESKRASETPGDGRQRGYTSLGIEHAKNHPTPDLKEFWHIGRDADDLPTNIFPNVAGFATTFPQLFTALDHVATSLLQAIGRYLERPPGFFDALTKGGNSVVRVIHYPPMHASSPMGAVRAAAHEDINLLTVLPVSTEPGLELRTVQGEWVAVRTAPGVMICDTGDMMQLLTNGRLPSTTHRVVNPANGANVARYSMPFFCHPRGEAVLRAAQDNAEQVTANAFLMQRLREIGVA